MVEIKVRINVFLQKNIFKRGKKTKKFLLITIVMLFLFSLIACESNGPSNNSNSNSIQLNLSNYETYLNVRASFGGSDATRYWTTLYREYWYPDLEGRVIVTPASTNFDYNNVILRVRIRGEFQTVGNDDFRDYDGKFDEIIEIRLNVGGSGSSSVIKSVTSLPGLKKGWREGSAKSTRGIGFEVVSVSGNVSRP